MKYIILAFLAISFLWFFQPKQDIYILYEKSSHIDTSYKANSKKAFFVYGMYFKKRLEQRLFLFERKVSERDTLSLNEIKTLDLKDYNWLERNFMEYYHFTTDSTPRIDSSGKTRYYNLNKFYNNIYVIKIDSSMKRAIIYKVKQDYLTDYEGFDIPLKNTTSCNK